MESKKSTDFSSEVQVVAIVIAVLGSAIEILAAIIKAKLYCGGAAAVGCAPQAGRFVSLRPNVGSLLYAIRYELVRPH